MSKLLLICYKQNQSIAKLLKEQTNFFTKRLTPDNLVPKPTQVISSNKLNILIFNPTLSLKVNNASVCLGNMLLEKNDWHEPMAEAPLGTYALFRSNDSFIELLSDRVASRTIWYYCDERIFVASTSQRAIIIAKGSFHFNDQVIPWMLTSGVIGPENSYDTEIKQLPPESRCVFDINNWNLKLYTKVAHFTNTPAPKHILRMKLEKELDYVFSNFSPNAGNWILPLSGGVDSRGILLMLLKHGIKPETITWGLPESKQDHDSDAFVASRLSKAFNITNLFYPVEFATDSFETVFNRFLIAGDGRIDHLSGYLDGFELWNGLFKNNVQGIIRGDEGFGWEEVYTEADVYNSLGINILTGSKLWNRFNELGIPEPLFPAALKRKKDEGISTWRDRLYHHYRIPVMLAALNDLKLPYLEITNPFLTHNIINFVQQLPENLRTRKVLFRNYIHSISPKIPYATRSSIQYHPDIFKNETVSNYLINEIKNNHKNDIFSCDFLNALINYWENSRQEDLKSKTGNRLKTSIKNLMPYWIKSILRNSFYTKEIDFKVFLFRTIILLKMNEICKYDATIFKT